MENFRVGVLDRLGFPVSRLHELNPRLVVLSITGFGHDGPEATRAGYDQIAQGEGGLMSITGTEPADQGRRPDRGPDRRHERRLRRGRRAARARPRPAAAASCARRCWPAWSACTPSRAPVDRGRRGARPLRRPPPVDRAVRHVRDRYRADPDRLRLGGPVAGAVHGASAGTRPRTGSPPTRERVANRDALIERLESLFADRAAEHWLALLADAGVPSGKVRSMDDVYSWDQTLSQGLMLVGRPLDPGPGRPARLAAALRRQRRSPAAAPRTSRPHARPAQRVDPGVAGLVR